MASKFTIHNGLESDSVNSPVNVTTGLEVGGLSFPSLSGKAWYVDAAATGGANGRTKADAFTTIAAAITAADANDVIFVFAGTYAENLTVADNYVTLVGVQTGYGRPDVQPASGVGLTVTGQGFRCSRVRFAAAAATHAVRQQANGFEYTDCVFDGDGGTTVGVLLKGNATSTGKTASEGVIRNCLFRGANRGLVFDTGDAPGNGVGCTHDVVDACRFIDNTQDVITLDSGTGVYSVQDTLISGCKFLDKNKTVYVDFTTANGGAASAQDGMLSDCDFATDSITTTNIAIVGTGWTVVNCRDTVGVQDGSGLD
ncbi:MAG: hypothetical protein ACRDZ4_10860 [Egibacteraceae bacterium]